MALSQTDRIAISKKIIDIPKEDVVALDNKSKLEDARLKAQSTDDANKSLFDIKNVLINSYQAELSRSNGVGYTQVLEQDLQDTSVNKLGNYFSPNQLAIPTPALTDGVWKQFIPYSGNKALGKTYGEVYTSTAKEGDLTTVLSGYITTMESYSNIRRSTGQECNGGGTCSLPAYTTQPTCVAASPTPGVWTVGPDVISTDSIVHGTATSLTAEVNSWKSFIQATIPFITTTDTNLTKQAENDAAIADINNSVSIINTWLARADFDTAHGQTTCVGFNAYNVALLSATKFRAAELQLLKNEITARLSFISTRIGQISSTLGAVVQDLTTGSLTSTTGLYGSRMNIINLRLNLMNGSLRKVEGIKMGKKSQDESIASNASASSVYNDVLLVSEFTAPALGSPIIHVKSATGFSPMDAVYIITNTQQEISTTILAVSGNMITLGAVIPAKYRQTDGARIYKVL